MIKRNVLNSPRLSALKKRRRRTVVNKILLTGLGFFIVFFFLSYLSRIDRLNISEIEISGNKILDTKVLKTFATEQIAGKYLWLFPKTNILYYPQNKIKLALQNKFPRLREVNLSIKNNKILEISLTEREAKYTWCGATPPEGINLPETHTNNQKCYFLDGDGYAFDEAPYFSGEVYFKFFGSISLNDLGTPYGSYFYKENFKQMVSFINTLKNFELKPSLLYIKTSGDAEIQLTSGKILPVGPKIIFNKDLDLEKTALNLQAALITEPLKTRFKTKYSSLLYIDLRFGNKVYYKFQ